MPPPTHRLRFKNYSSISRPHRSFFLRPLPLLLPPKRHRIHPPADSHPTAPRFTPIHKMVRPTVRTLAVVRCVKENCAVSAFPVTDRRRTADLTTHPADDWSVRFGRMVSTLPVLLADPLQVGEGAQGRLRSGVRFPGQKVGDTCSSSSFDAEAVATPRTSACFRFSWPTARRMFCVVAPARLDVFNYPRAPLDGSSYLPPPLQGSFGSRLTHPSPCTHVPLLQALPLPLLSHDFRDFFTPPPTISCPCRRVHPAGQRARNARLRGRKGIRAYAVRAGS